MYITKITDNFDSFINYTKNENECVSKKIKYLLFPIPSSVLLLCLISIFIWTILKPLSNIK